MNICGTCNLYVFFFFVNGDGGRNTITCTNTYSFTNPMSQVFCMEDPG